MLSITCRTIGLTALIVLISLTTNANAELIDKVVAVVNNDVITLSELNEETDEVINKIKLEASDEELESAIFNVREQALDSLIDRLLIKQKAKESRVTVSDQEVQQTIDGIRNKAKLNVEEFNKELIKSGISPTTYSTNIKSQLLQRKIVNYDIRAKIVIPESEILAFYNKEYIAEAAADEFFLLQIGIGWADGNKQKAKEQAERVHKLATNGQDFPQLAQKFSTLPSAKDGGDIGSFTIDDMSENMAKTISPLKPGQVSDIIETSSAYQFFKVLSGGTQQKVVKESYTMVKDKIHARLFEIQMQQKFQEWIKELKADAYIQKI